MFHILHSVKTYLKAPFSIELLLYFLYVRGPSLSTVHCSQCFVLCSLFFISCMSADPHCPLFTVRNVLSSVRCSLFAGRCGLLAFVWLLCHLFANSLFTIHCSPFTVHCSMFIFKCSLFTVHCSLFAVRCLPFHCSLFTVHCTLYSAHCLLSLVTFHSFLFSPVTEESSFFLFQHFVFLSPLPFFLLC